MRDGASKWHMTCDEHGHMSPGTSFTPFTSDVRHFESTTCKTYEKFIFPYRIKRDDQKSALIYYCIKEVLSMWKNDRIHVHDELWL